MGFGLSGPDVQTTPCYQHSLLICNGDKASHTGTVERTKVDHFRAASNDYFIFDSSSINVLIMYFD